MNCNIFASMNLKKYSILLFLVFSFNMFSQNELNEDIESKNRFNVGWAYYGRGNGISVVYDRELNSTFSAGLGLEFYFIDEKLESSYFLVGDIHLKEVLDLKNGLDIYPGFEIGFFESDFAPHFYLGLSKSLTSNLGLYTEIGTRGILGLYYNF